MNIIQPMQSHWKPFMSRRLSIKQCFRLVIEWRRRRTLTSVTSAFNWRTLFTVLSYTHPHMTQTLTKLHAYTHTHMHRYKQKYTHKHKYIPILVYQNIYIYIIYWYLREHQSQRRRTWINCHRCCRQLSQMKSPTEFIIL